MLGQTLGNFRIVESMGEGGMGQLYLARHVSMDRRAVVKVLRSHLAEDDGIVRRFVNEANAAAMIGHPGIVYVMDVGRLDTGSPYILMEYLEGESLAQRLAHTGKLDLPAALSIIRQIADALAAAHDKGIVHRDLKPGNIFLTRDASVVGSERVKILDFGIAKLLTHGHDAVATHTDIILGTPLYMSPEQCDGARIVDHRSDFYSLGCILYELVCGRTPFEPAGAGTLIAAHLLKDPPRPSSIEESIPAELEALILRLLAKMPDDRFQSAHELIAAIDSMAGQWSGAWVGMILDNGDPMRTSGMTALARAAGQRVQADSQTSSPLVAPPVPLTSGMPVSYPTFTAQLGAGESMLIATLHPDRRRMWAILAGMGAVVVAAIVAWPWLQDVGQPATRATAAPTARASAPAAPVREHSAPDLAVQPGAAANATPSARPAPPARPARPTPSLPSGAGEPAAAAATALTSVAVEIASRPKDAQVYRNGELLGRTPYRDTFPVSAEALVFVIKKPGYEDQVVEIPADHDRVQAVELERKRARRPPSRKGSRPTLRPEEGGPVDPF